MTRFFDKIVIGHNAFFGVDHLSSARGQERAAYFEDVEKVLEVLRWSQAAGATGLMMSTHDRAPRIARELMKDKQSFFRAPFLSALPYVQKYVVAANQKGMLTVIFDMLSEAKGTDVFRHIWNGTKALLTKDFFSILSSLIRIELGPYRDFNIPCVFLHDIFTDLALALDMRDIVGFYHEELEKNFQTKAAFATKNLPMLLEKFKIWGFPKPLVMCHVNKIGFRMSPSQALCEQALQQYPVHVMAMSSLASGYLKPEEAFAYLGQFPQVESVVVGASTRAHIEESFAAVSRCLKDAA